MTAVWILARYTFRECLRRRVFLVIPVATGAYLALFALGTHYAFRFVAAEATAPQGGLIDARVLTGATLMGLALFATMFLGTVIAVFLTFTTIRGDAEAGLLQPLVVRPIPRSAVLLGRFVGAGIVGGVYVTFLYVAAVVTIELIGGWHPTNLVTPLVHLVAAVLVITTLSLLGSVFLPTIANGIVVMMVYGAGLLAGLLGQIGLALGNGSLHRVGRIGAWVLPFEALYQSALDALTAGTAGLTRVIVRLGPFGGAETWGAGLWVWVVAYATAVLAGATWALARRDL